MERIGAVLLVLVLAQPTQAAVEMFYLHNDHLGTPRVVTNQLQQVVWKGHLKPFGETQVEIETITNHRRFPGQRFDIESRLHYNYFRDYDPRTGRYIQSDPIGLQGGLNTYAYVAGNPVGNIDPAGLAGCVVLFPDYPIDTGYGFTSTSLGGHGGVLSYDDATGYTRYYEYGRYLPSDPYVVGEGRPKNEGNVRRIPIPNLVIDPKTGQPTVASVEALREKLSEKAGHNTKVELTCDNDADENKINAYAEELANNPNRPTYNWAFWSSNQCRDFSNNAFDAGR